MDITNIYLIRAYIFVTCSSSFKLHMLYFVLEEFNVPSVLLEYLDLFTSLWSSERETFMRHIKAVIIIKDFKITVIL